MAEARQTDAWNRTSALLALLANAHRDPKKSRPARPADFHPLTKRNSGIHGPQPKVDITILKSVFVDRRQVGF